MTTTEANTPRTRNRVLDNSIPMSSPEGYTGDDWTLRKKIEADFRALGFKSHKFSHKNEPENRPADSLLLSWNHYSKNNVGIVTRIEVRVDFPAHPSGYYGIEHKTVFTVIYEGRTPRACIAHRMGKATFTIDWTDTSDIMAYIKHLLTK